MFIQYFQQHYMFFFALVVSPLYFSNGVLRWPMQPTRYVTITARRNSDDTTDSVDVERVNLKKIVSQLKNNLYNVSVLSEPDLEMLTNMDPNSVADITGKDFIEQLKEVSGRLGGKTVESVNGLFSPICLF